ncbi:glycosyltransferase family 4 protein [Nocardia sp. NPDC051756]|uniref:glycosyltransferase family 4 protein n=1 Tax=Nocardia sp. NPDC051756 TaxID=3154751 RepID=UPI0034461CA3
MATADLPGAQSLRILMVIDSLQIGGTERHLIGLATGLAARGHRVSVACSVGGELRPALEQIPVQVITLSSRVVHRRVSVVLAVKLWKLLRHGNFDIVHAHQVASATASLVAAMVSRTPVVVTEHTMAAWRGRWARCYTRWLYRSAAHCLAVSAPIGERLVHVDRVRAERVTVIPGVIFPPYPTPRRPIPEPGLIVGVLARLHPDKGVEVFLEAVARLTEPVAAWFVIIGAGPLDHQLRRQATELGLNDRIRFLGARPDGPALIGGLDILVVPSHTEGSPLVVLEAMGAGVAIIASGVGGIPDQLDQGRAGILVPPADPAALATALTHLINQPHDREQLGANARAHFTDNHHPDRMIVNVQQTYQAILKTRAQKAS